MNCTEILINNLKKIYGANSIRVLAKKMNFSENILLNWSSLRTAPNIKQLNEIAYNIPVEVFMLLIEDNDFTINSNIWKDNVENVLYKNLLRLREEKGITEKYFTDYSYEIGSISYRSFLRIINKKNKNINLSVLEKLALIFDIEPYKLLESERKIK